MVVVTVREACGFIRSTSQNPFYGRYNKIIVWLTLLTDSGLVNLIIGIYSMVGID